ncbi:MAG: hypothetical protein WA921_03180 [Ahrensia sp.]
MKVAVKVSSDAMIRALRLALLDTRQKVAAKAESLQNDNPQERDNVSRS